MWKIRREWNNNDTKIISVKTKLDIKEAYVFGLVSLNGISTIIGYLIILYI